MSSLVSFSDAQKAAALVYQGSGFVPSGWEIDLSFNAGLPPATPGELALDNGFYAYAVKPTADNTAADPSARMLVFRGTETANPISFVTDFLADVRDIGENQFSLAADRINQWLAQELVDGHKVELVGHGGKTGGKNGDILDFQGV